MDLRFGGDDQSEGGVQDVWRPCGGTVSSPPTMREEWRPEPVQAPLEQHGQGPDVVQPSRQLLGLRGGELPWGRR